MLMTAHSPQSYSALFTACTTSDRTYTHCPSEFMFDSPPYSARLPIPLHTAYCHPPPRNTYTPLPVSRHFTVPSKYSTPFSPLSPHMLLLAPTPCPREGVG
jgi:hypothetical protein